MRAKANAGMVQIFSTFGLAIVMRGLAQFFFTPDYRSIPQSWLGGKTISVAGIFLPEPQLIGALVSIAAFAGLYFFIHRTDFGRALEATREDPGAVALVGIDKNRVFAFGWGLGAALVGLAGAIMAVFFYIYPDVGASFALIAYVTVALGGFGSVFGAFAGGLIAAIIAMGLGYPFFRLRGHYFVIATIVIAEIGLLLFQNWEWAGAAMGITIPVRGDSWLKFQFVRSKLPYFYFALALCCLAWFVTWWLEDSKWGFWWRAVKDNPEAAESLGVVVFNSKMGAAAVSAFLTAIGGAFDAQVVAYIDPESVT